MITKTIKKIAESKHIVYDNLDKIGEIPIYYGFTPRQSPSIKKIDIDQARSLLDGDGSALVIHAKADDYMTDPAGDAGDRIACGVVTP